LDVPDFAETVLEAEEDEFDVPEGGIETDIVLGDLFEIGEHRLLCGDSTDSDQVAKLMNGQKADMVFTDPPYGVDYEGINNDDRGGLEDLLRGAFGNMMVSTNNGGSFYCFHSDKCSDIFSKVYREFCHFSSMIIWVKESIVLSQTDYQSKHEPCMYGWFDNGTHKWYSDRKQESVWIAKSKREEGHTTPKPIDIITKALNNSSKVGMSVLDLFLGSGSTMVASHQLKRKCYGMELDCKYVEVIVQRMIKLDKTLIIKRNGIDETKKWLNKLG
jgi:DNA modification methylase